MEQKEAWSKQKPCASRSMEQSHWSRKEDGALQKNGTSRSQEQAEACGKPKPGASRSS
jgi:hypothetical protein